MMTPRSSSSQNPPGDSGIATALERIAEAFRAQTQETATRYGLSPLQVQILSRMLKEKPGACSVSSLAQGLGLTRPTVSDAVKTLEEKGFLTKAPDKLSARQINLTLTRGGRTRAKQVAQYAKNITKAIAHLGAGQKDALFKALSQIIRQLQTDSVIH